MRCPTCRRRNPEDATFCGECGEPVAQAVACPGCGRENPPGLKFCHQCGQALESTLDTQPRPTKRRDSRRKKHPLAAGLHKFLKAAGAYGESSKGSQWLERLVAEKLREQGIDPSTLISSVDAVASTVVSEQPDLRAHAAPDGTVTILFTDIEDSTELNGRLGDDQWLALLRGHKESVREIIHAHDGFEVKSEGDGFMVAFQSAQRGVNCAVAIQRAISAIREEQDVPIRVRIGLHTGEAVREADDFYGWHVNLASRIADQANGGEILASDVVRQVVSGKGVLFSDRGPVPLRGFDEPLRLFEVAWREDDDA